MKKRDFESYHKRFRDVEVLKKFSETHVFRGKIRHPYLLIMLNAGQDERTSIKVTVYLLFSFREKSKIQHPRKSLPVFSTKGSRLEEK